MITPENPDGRGKKDPEPQREKHPGFDRFVALARRLTKNGDPIHVEGSFFDYLLPADYFARASATNPSPNDVIGRDDVHTFQPDPSNPTIVDVQAAIFTENLKAPEGTPLDEFAEHFKGAAAYVLFTFRTPPRSPDKIVYANWDVIAREDGMIEETTVATHHEFDPDLIDVVKAFGGEVAENQSAINLPARPFTDPRRFSRFLTQLTHSANELTAEREQVVALTDMDTAAGDNEEVLYVAPEEMQTHEAESDLSASDRDDLDEV